MAMMTEAEIHWTRYGQKYSERRMHLCAIILPAERILLQLLYSAFFVRGIKCLPLREHLYDTTIHNVIGISGSGMGSLKDFGIVYDEVPPKMKDRIMRQ